MSLLCLQQVVHACNILNVFLSLLFKDNRSSQGNPERFYVESDNRGFPIQKRYQLKALSKATTINLPKNH